MYKKIYILTVTSHNNVYGCFDIKPGCLQGEPLSTKLAKLVLPIVFGIYINNVFFTNLHISSPQ